MLHNQENENGTPLFHTRKTKEGFEYMRQSAKPGAKPFGRTTFKKGPGKAKGGIATAYLPESLFKQVLIASKASKRSIADIVRAGIIREVGAIAMVIEDGQNLSAFNLQGKEAEPVKPVKQAPVVPKGHVVVSKKDLKELHAAVVRAIKISSK